MRAYLVPDVASADSVPTTAVAVEATSIEGEPWFETTRDGVGLYVLPSSFRNTLISSSVAGQLILTVGPHLKKSTVKYCPSWPACLNVRVWLPGERPVFDQMSCRAKPSDAGEYPLARSGDEPSIDAVNAACRGATSL